MLFLSRDSRAVQRSRMYVWNAKQRKKKETKQYCIFYNRFGELKTESETSLASPKLVDEIAVFPGKCNRGDACPYVHDPTKIAICSK